MAYFYHVIVHNEDKGDSESNWFTCCALKALKYMHLNLVPEFEVTQSGEHIPCHAFLWNKRNKIIIFVSCYF